MCVICKDPFEQFYDDDEEEWHLRDAIRIENKTYHPVCYEDAKNVSKYYYTFQTVSIHGFGKKSGGSGHQQGRI